MKGIVGKGNGRMAKEKKTDDRENDKLRRIKVNVVYGKDRLTECMEYVIRAKYNLR